MTPRLLFVVCAAMIVSSSCQDANAPDNNPPRLARIADQSIPAGVTRVTDLIASDPDGDELTFSIIGNPGFVSLEDVDQVGDTATARCVMAPSAAHAGTYSVGIRVEDSRGEHHTRIFSVAAIAPERGRWWGTAEFGQIAFDVSSARTAMTEMYYLFDGWQCGIVTLYIDATAENATGWPINAGSFKIENSFPSIDLDITVDGTFRANDSASGTWSAELSGTPCSGTWEAEREAPGNGYAPGLGVFVSPDFSQTSGVLGHGWRIGSQVTLEIDNGANGSVEYQRTKAADAQGNVNFRDYGDVVPFSIAEGDVVRMYDGVTVVEYDVLYVTLDDVDLSGDVVSGSAREGTVLDVRVFNPAFPFPEGPEISVTADSNDSWSADFGGVFDIVADSRGWIATYSGPGHTQIGWQLPLSGASRVSLRPLPPASRASSRPTPGSP